MGKHRSNRVQLTVASECLVEFNRVLNQFHAIHQGTLDKEKSIIRGKRKAWSFMRNEHFDLFGDNGRGLPKEWIKTRVLTVLEFRGKEQHEQAVSDRLLQNYSACIENNMEGLHPETLSILKFQIKSGMETESTAKPEKKKVAPKPKPKPKSPRKTKDRRVLTGFLKEQLLADNTITNLQLRKLCLKKFNKDEIPKQLAVTIWTVRHNLVKNGDVGGFPQQKRGRRKGRKKK